MTTSTDTIFSKVGKKAYYVDAIYKYADMKDFISYVNLPYYLQPIQTVSVNRFEKSAVDNLISTIIDFDESIPTPTIPTNAPALIKDKKWGNGDKDVVTINFTTTNDTSIAETVYNKLLTALEDPASASAQKKLAKLQNNHKLADKFMESIVTTLCEWKFEDLKSSLIGNVSLQTLGSADVLSAFNLINELTNIEMKTIMNDIHNLSGKAISSMVIRKKPSVYLLDGYTIGVGDVTALEQNKFKNLLREMIYDKLIIRNLQSTDIELQYVRRILSEMYVIAYNPYVHFQYIKELEKKFQNEGDFVNMRVSALCKVMFTINTLLALFDMYPAGQTNIVVQWIGALKGYLSNLSRVDFNDPNVTIQDVISDVHELSSGVATRSMSIDEIKLQIKQSQLQIRSILARYSQMHKEQQKKAIQYNVLIVFIILLVAVSGVMIVTNYKKQYLMYVLASIVGLVIFTRTVMSIISMAKSK